MKEQDIAFIRCPSCNSLIPSTATRCRMCGFNLAGEEDVSVQEQKPGGRVKQKTVSLDAQNVEQIKDASKKTKANASVESEKNRANTSEDEELGRDIMEAPPERNTSDRKGTRRISKPPTREPEKVVEEDLPVELPVEVEYEEVKDSEIESRVEQDSEAVESDDSSSASAVVEASKAQSGASSSCLLGWLVNYQDDKHGLAIEIREGRFLVSREKLRDNDISIFNESISTPHCLLQAAGFEEIKVADLMSEAGTFLKKASDKDFKKALEAKPLSNGDILKLGDYEFIVCLIPKLDKKSE